MSLNIETITNVAFWSSAVLVSTLIAGNLIMNYLDNRKYKEALISWRCNIRNRKIDDTIYGGGGDN